MILHTGDNGDARWAHSRYPEVLPSSGLHLLDLSGDRGTVGGSKRRRRNVRWLLRYQRLHAGRELPWCSRSISAGHKDLHSQPETWDLRHLSTSIERRKVQGGVGCDTLMVIFRK
jgi:hypothetical protein